MDLPQLITNPVKSRTAQRSEANYQADNEYTTQNETDLDVQNEATIRTPLGVLTKNNSIEINKAHPSAISGRQDIRHGTIDAEYDQPDTKIPVGLYRMAFDTPVTESPNVEIQTEEMTTENNDQNPAEQQLTPENFLSGIRNEALENSNESTNSQQNENLNLETETDTSRTDDQPNQMGSKPDADHQIPYQPEHSHFQAEAVTEQKQDFSKTGHDSQPEEKSTDSAQYLAHIQSEREKAQAELLGEM